MLETQGTRGPKAARHKGIIPLKQGSDAVNPLVIQAASQRLLELVEPLPRGWVVAGRDEATANSDEVPEQVHVPDAISGLYALEKSCQLSWWGSRCIVH